MATWYVRPDTSHSGTRNGTSYATAWGGWSAITWGAGGVTAGDTLYVCGSHAYAATITVGAHLGTAGNVCTISGAYAPDPGSVTFSGASFINLGRSYTTIFGLTVSGGTSNCAFVSGALTGNTFAGNTFNAGTQSIISFSGGNATSYTDTVISGNTFTGDCRNASNSTGAIHWQPATAAAVSTHTRLTISGNIFKSLTTGRAAIHLRPDAGTGLGTTMTDVVVTGNTFDSVLGYAVEVADEHAVFGQCAGIQVTRNIFRDCGVSPISTSLGGAISIKGFVSSALLGVPLVELNTASGVIGPAGFCNMFYGTYIVRDNIASDLSTLTIDGNGVLFDFGADKCAAYRNTFYRLTGKSGVSNSGVGVMVLNSTNTTVYGNSVDSCLTGVHLGSAGAGQSCSIYGNTFANCIVSGVDVLAGATEANDTVKNNAFTASTAAAVSVRNSGGAWSGEDYNSFSGFAAATGHTLGANDKSANPALTPDLRLTGASPLIGAGVHLGYGLAFRDADGKQRPNPPSIGAYDVATLRRKLTADPAS